MLLDAIHSPRKGDVWVDAKRNILGTNLAAVFGERPKLQMQHRLLVRKLRTRSSVHRARTELNRGRQDGRRLQTSMNNKGECCNFDFACCVRRVKHVHLLSHELEQKEIVVDDSVSQSENLSRV